MSYNTIANMAQDFELQRRITACAVSEHKQDPSQWASERMWQLAATPGWADAYEYAVANDMNNPGKRENVITDSMILAAVQPMV
jgi:hypothetical protein